METMQKLIYPADLREVKNLKDFIRLRWRPDFHDAQSFSEFLKVLRNNEIKLQDITLGELLGLANFDAGSDFKKSWKMMDSESDKLGPLKAKYGFSDDSGILYIQGINERNLQTFIDNWYNSRVRNSWNPNYAPSTKLDQRVTEFAKRHNVTEILREFNLFNHGISKSVMDYENYEDFFIGMSRGIHHDLVFYPMDSWDLARCMQHSYESKQNRNDERVA